MKITQADRIAIIIIFVVAPLTGVAVNWVAALAAVAGGLAVALFSSAGEVARMQAAAKRRQVYDGETGEE